MAAAKFISVSLLLILTMSLLFAVPALAAADGPVRVETRPAAVAPNEHTLVTVHLAADEAADISGMRIDASALGMEDEITVDLALGAVTLSVRSDIAPGIKTLHLILLDEARSRQVVPFDVEVLPEPTDNVAWDETVIYFLLTDRFSDGDPDNNDPYGEGYDPGLPETYHGGDFQGIIDRLDYLQDLGISMIWITPIVDNVDHNARAGKDGPQYGYHGYWAKDFEAIDEHLGSLETFHRLIDEAAARGIGIMVDVVLNHAGYGMKETDLGEGISHFPSAADQDVFAGMLRPDPAPHTVTGELAGLPDFVTEDPSVRSQLIAWQTAWIEKSRTAGGNRIAAFRADTVKHVEPAAWKALKNAVTRIDPAFKLLGEWYGATADADGGSLKSGGMDALLDFGFKEIAQQYIRGEIERGERRLNHRHEKITNIDVLAPFLSSHDEDGFLATRALNDVGLHKVAATLQLTAKGVPVIYYGEEIGMSGKAAGDMDRGEFSENRGDFAWDLVPDNDMLAHYKALLRIRNDYATLFARGERTTLMADDQLGAAVFTLTYGEEQLIVGINTTDHELTVQVPAETGNLTYADLFAGGSITSRGGQLTAVLPPRNEGGTCIAAVAPARTPLSVLLVPAAVLLLIALAIVARIRHNAKHNA